jgi:hypothetical protein
MPQSLTEETAPKMLQEAFKNFALATFGQISAEQYVDLQRTFIGGASCLLSLLFNEMTPGDETTDHDMNLMRSISREIGEFVEDVKRGKK